MRKMRPTSYLYEWRKALEECGGDESAARRLHRFRRFRLWLQRRESQKQGIEDGASLLDQAVTLLVLRNFKLKRVNQAWVAEDPLGRRTLLQTDSDLHVFATSLGKRF